MKEQQALTYESQNESPLQIIKETKSGTESA